MTKLTRMENLADKNCSFVHLFIHSFMARQPSFFIPGLQKLLYSESDQCRELPRCVSFQSCCCRAAAPANGPSAPRAFRPGPPVRRERSRWCIPTWQCVPTHPPVLSRGKFLRAVFSELTYSVLSLAIPISGVQEKMGIMNKGVIYALWDYEPQNDDELPMKEGDCMTIVRREDEDEVEWWWARLSEKEGYVPRNLLGVSHRHSGVFCVSEGPRWDRSIAIAFRFRLTATFSMISIMIHSTFTEGTGLVCFYKKVTNWMM